MLLPGESISKYNRADGEAPAPAPAGGEWCERRIGPQLWRAATVIAVVIATVVDVDVAGIVTGIVDVAVTGNASRANMRVLLYRRTTLRLFCPANRFQSIAASSR